mmetsp:Transcript_89192/g.186390  ORF Transcript_89192/g.186390 Transcript_89192/m.186390 type:complete len:203 (+) Transcript_89192:134-742(+)
MVTQKKTMHIATRKQRTERENVTTIQKRRKGAQPHAQKYIAEALTAMLVSREPRQNRGGLRPHVLGSTSKGRQKWLSGCVFWRFQREDGAVTWLVLGLSGDGFVILRQDEAVTCVDDAVLLWPASTSRVLCGLPSPIELDRTRGKSFGSSSPLESGPDITCSSSSVSTFASTSSTSSTSSLGLAAAAIRISTQDSTVMTPQT